MGVHSLINDARISAREVQDALVNLKQLVFEVTDACNLKCKYCAYGDLYFGYDKREDSFLSLEKGRAIIDYLCDIWESFISDALIPTTYISFYGGEPLLNFNFIKEIVDYVQAKDVKRHIIFSMTTNGMLLDRYIDYLSLHSFNLLISLDGNSESNGHRITHAGLGSYEKIYANIKMIQDKYPRYYQNHVNFNSVLHNLNDVESVYKYFSDEFEKEPNISELNTSNIREDKKEEFLSLYKNKEGSIKESKDLKNLSRKILMGNPLTHDLLIFLHQHSGNVYKNYSDLFVNKQLHHFCPTGTCVPFGKKMFVTVRGKILQCEKIPQNYAFGCIDSNNDVNLDFERIAQQFNSLLDKVQHQCSGCFIKMSCTQCVYYIDGINGDKPKCQAYMNKSSFEQYSGRCLMHLYTNPELYNKLLKEIIVE